MTNPPGEGQPPPEPDENQPGYWEQQGQQGQPPPYDQPPYGQQSYGQAPVYPAQAPLQYAPDHPKATTVLVLGILGIVVCGIIAPFAWTMGRTTLQEIDASNGQLGGRGAANAGYVLGIIGTVLLAVAVLLMVIALIALIIGAAASTST